jgi:hypothetical protein
VENHSQLKHIDMKIRILSVLAAILLLIIPLINFAQAPPLGTAGDFVLFTSVGAVSNVGTTDRAKFLTHLTGNVGFETGSITGFGNVNGVIHSGDGASIACAGDLLLAYNFLAAAIPDSTIVNPVIGNDSIFKAGTYQLPNSASSLNLGLTLDAEGDPNAVFIFKMPAGPPIYAFSTSANSKINLINEAQACNVYWFFTGPVDMGTGTTMRGTIISGGAINMSASDTLEGRALTINGAITLDNGDVGLLAYKPGCNSPTLTGPTAPVFTDSKCFTIFSSNGPVADDFFSQITGYVGGNTAAPSNYNPLLVPDGIYGIDGTTAAAAADLGNVYSYLNGLTEDIILTAPTLLGHNLVLTPHTYLLGAAATLTDTLYLDALGNADAVFIIKTQGAFATTNNSNIKLINGTRAENVYWLVNGAVSITTNSIFNGTVVVSGAIDILAGTQLNGRALSIDQAVSTHSIIATLTPACNTTSAPEITVEPTDQNACEGESATFTVTATGTDLTYQWRKGTEELIDGLTISGATSNTLTIDPVSASDAATNYNVIVSGLVAPNDTSINVTFVVNVDPVITGQPTDQAICEIGDSVSFLVEATGTGLTYQWRKGAVDVVDGLTISGATTDMLTINPTTITDVSDLYYVVVSGTCSPNDTSTVVSLTMNGAPTITVEPENQEVCNEATVSFTVAATGAGLTYQWRKGAEDLIDGDNISGATTETLTIDPVGISDTGNDYYVVVGGTCSPNDTSINVSLQLNAAPTITEEPEDQDVCNETTVSFTVVATGAGLTYQWRKDDLTISDDTTYSGTTTNTLTINMLNFTDLENDLLKNFNVIVSGECLPSDTSVYVSVIHNSAPSISEQPVHQAICQGGLAMFSVVATGTNLTYQWRKGTINLIDDDRISGSTSASLTIDSIISSDNGDDYNVVISGACLPNVISDNVQLYVGNTPIITTQASDQRVCAGGVAVFSIIDTGRYYGYRWRKGTVDLVNGGNISGANTPTLTIFPVNPEDAANDYNVLIYGACFFNVISENSALIVDLEPIIITEPTDQTVCSGSSVSIFVSASGTGLTYHWRRGTIDLIDGGNISGVNSPVLTIDRVSRDDVADDYNVVIKGLCAPHVTSQYVSVEIDNTPSITSQPADKTVCEESSVSFSVTTSGTGNSYQWRRGSVNLTDGGTISGANSSVLTINPVNISDAASDYNVVISGGCMYSDTSANASLEVEMAPEITNGAVDQTVCIGSSASFSMTAIGTGLTYQWRKGTVNLINGGNISGANSAELTINPVSNSDVANNYNVVVSGECQTSKTSLNVSLKVNSATTIINEPTDQTACSISSASFSVVASGSELTYQWRKGSVNLVNGGNISGANSPMLTINPVTNSDAATNYNVVVSSECMEDKVSVNASLVLNSFPTIKSEPTNQTTCDGGSVSFSVTAIGTGLTYQWRKGSVNLTDGGSISGANSSMLTINPANSSNAASNYNVVVGGECLPAKTSYDVSLTVNAIPNITLEPADKTVCAGSPVSFSVAATGSGLSYQWRKGTVNLNSGGRISGATSTELKINSVSSTDASSDYNVVVIGSCLPNKISTTANLMVNTAPEITAQPVDQTLCVNDCSINFMVAANGTGLTYQWRKGAVNLVNSGKIAGANSTMLTINQANTSDISSQYNVVVSGVCSPASTSIDAALLGRVSSSDIADNSLKVLVYPNPFTTSLNFIINDFTEESNCELKIFNLVGKEVIHTTITKQSTTLVTSNLRSGFYFYKVIENNQVIQTGKLILEN